MLNFTPSASDTAAAIYFDQSLSKENQGSEYLLKEDIIAHYEGETAKYLGVYGEEATKENFSRFANNRYHDDPSKKITLRDAINRRPGWDITTNAVKSHSILYALSKDPELLEAFQYANTEVMKAFQSQVMTQHNTREERGYEKVGNAMWCTFQHFLARPVQVEHGGELVLASDASIHAHNYVFNFCKSLERDRFQALEIGHVSWPYLEAYFHSVLSHRLNQIGYQVQRNHDKYEIISVSREIIEKYSNRAREIDDYALKHKITDPKEKAKLAVKTRKGKKTQTISGEELYQVWKDRLSPEEFEALKSIKGSTHEIPKPYTAKEAIDLSLEHHLERTSTIDEKRVLAHALTLGYGHLLPSDVEKELNSRTNIIRLEEPTGVIITTREKVYEEDQMISLAVSGKGKFQALNEDYKITKDYLNEGQRKAIKDILSSKDQINLLLGSAGVGKSTLLETVIEGAAQAQKPIFAAAPSTQATQVLKSMNLEAHTVQALLVNKQLQDKLQGQTLLVDEAPMLGTKKMLEVLRLVREKNAKLILSGDLLQHGAPGQYGDAVRILQSQAKVQTSTVKKIMRQKPKEYREAVQQLANGQTLSGYQSLNRLGMVKEIADKDERLNKIADDYIGSVTKNRSALIVSPTNYEGSLLNNIVRQKLRQQNKLKGKDRTFDTLQNLSFTNAQKKDVRSYQEGMVVRYTRNTKSGKAGSHWEVLPSKKADDVSLRDIKTGQVSSLALGQVEHIQVYEKTKTQIAKGDHIRLTNIIRAGETKLNNGNTYQVKEFVKNGIKLSNGKTVPNDTYHFKHAYAETSYSSQGKTCQDVYIGISDISFAATNREAFYVGASRGIHSATIYTSSIDDLKKAIIKSGQQRTAREVAEGHEQRLLQQKQQAHYRAMNEKIKENGRTKGREKFASRVVSKEFTRH